MIILLDTSTSLCKLAVINGERRIDFEQEVGRSLAKDLLGIIRDSLAELGGDFSDISGLGVMRGPGSFTGLRIGLTVMNSLADSLSVPIVGADGDDWQGVALSRLQSGDNDQLVLPLYGGEAHITRPKK